MAMTNSEILIFVCGETSGATWIIPLPVRCFSDAPTLQMPLLSAI